MPRTKMPLLLLRENRSLHFRSPSRFALLLADSARILFGFWWFFMQVKDDDVTCLERRHRNVYFQVVTAFYTAELTAVLTMSLPELPVTE